MRTVLTQTRTATADVTLRLALRCRGAWTRLRDRAEQRDGGYSTETAIITALLAVLAIAVIGVIGSKVMAKVNGMQF
ncbi:hypothetical protein ABIA33_007377 [Streptacidiphilus sp. MAP12-16]|uniref:hypothetical protein n=1 Tax=Streptacidiphilus sp. MAP12-16 TaxID=3156300 RepID=UPI003514CEA4